MDRKLSLIIVSAVLLGGVLLAGCVTGTVGASRGAVRQPDVLDHKGLKFGQKVPEWVGLTRNEIETRDLYPQRYAFKFESPRAQDLYAAQLWTRNFEATSRISQLVSTRVRNKFVGAAAGDLDQLSAYLEQVVDSLAEVTIQGYQLESEYWVQSRYYDTRGNGEDAYTYFVLYTIAEQTLDQLVQRALTDAAANEVLSNEQERVRARVEEAFENGL